MQIEKAKSEIKSLAAKGSKIELVYVGDVQPFAHVRSVNAPAPPWDKSGHEILIAIPIASDLGTGLDGFYLKLPYTFGGGEHKRVNGGIISFAGSQWKLVSWHYADNKVWKAKVDSVETHIAHCTGFFFDRGATNAIA